LGATGLLFDGITGEDGIDGILGMTGDEDQRSFGGARWSAPGSGSPTEKPALTRSFRRWGGFVIGPVAATFET
jgi:hypothetical protein